MPYAIVVDEANAPVKLAKNVRRSTVMTQIPFLPKDEPNIRVPLFPGIKNLSFMSGILRSVDLLEPH